MEGKKSSGDGWWWWLHNNAMTVKYFTGNDCEVFKNNWNGQFYVLYFWSHTHTKYKNIFSTHAFDQEF